KEETVEVTSDVTEQLVAFTKRGKTDHHHVQEVMAEIEVLMKAGQKKTAQSKTPDWFQVQLPTIQSVVNDAKKNKAFASVLSNESFLQRVANQSGVTHTHIGRTTVGLTKYVKTMSFDEKLRTGQGWFAHSPLGRSLLHYRTDPRFQFLYSFATKVPLAAMRSTMTFEPKQQKDTLEGRVSVDALKTWWNETITHRIDLSLLRIVSLAFTGIPASTKNTTVDAGETGEAKTTQNPFMKSLNSFKEIGDMWWGGMTERTRKSTDSWYDFSNYITLGLVGGAVWTWEGMENRYAQFRDDKSMSTFVNYITMGGDEMVVGTFTPEDPFSAEHWLNSIGVAGIVAGGSLAGTTLRSTTNQLNTGPRVNSGGQG
ncbi:hypothetical protein MW695_22020, partial [Alkalihalobacillus sp. APA_J-10(15)]|nr:hypothetical protein [Halalkalibacter sp. APA_J-10(15)]